MNYPYLIKKLREILIITQTELAEILEVSFSSVNRWENG
ncbi:helix-turn-helix transcriptional regulator [Mycoplasmatota bacterium WC44]